MMNMEVRILFILAAFAQWKMTFSVRSFSGRISEDVTFFHETFPVPPSMRAIIQVSVIVPRKFITKSRSYPLMGIYTTQDHINIREKCIDRPYGQLGNRNLHPGLTMNKHRSRPLTCELLPIIGLFEGIAPDLHFHGNIIVQDYFPRKFSFSFGFHCLRISSLRGLKYSIKIQSIKSQMKRLVLNCHPHSRAIVICNMVFILIY